MKKDRFRRLAAMTLAVVTLWITAAAAGSDSLREAVSAAGGSLRLPELLLRWELGDLAPADALSLPAMLALRESPLLLSAWAEVAALPEPETPEPEEASPAPLPPAETPAAQPDAADYEDNGAAAQTIAQQGYDYPVKVSLERTYFPTKVYADFSLPAGEYQGLRVEIGQAEGHNWWCVVFPPLCFSSVSEQSEAALRSGLTEDDLALLTGEDQGYVFRFQCLEWFGQLKQWLAHC